MRTFSFLTHTFNLYVNSIFFDPSSTCFTNYSLKQVFSFFADDIADDDDNDDKDDYDYDEDTYLYPYDESLCEQKCGWLSKR